MKDNPTLPYERKEKSRVRYGQPIGNCAENGFKCAHCHCIVTTGPVLSGVLNRNHCPNCLWSRHLDLHAAGDRLSACKALMKPIGLTIKRTCKKYDPKRGELMLIHVCKECHNLSINRIAADDNPKNIFAVFEGSFQLERTDQDRLESGGIRLLGKVDIPLVNLQLFGIETSLAEMLFQYRKMEIV
jgi:cytochrome c2